MATGETGNPNQAGSFSSSASISSAESWSEYASLTQHGLAYTGGPEILGEALARDVETSLRLALDAGAVFRAGPDPLTFFREFLAASVREVDADP